MASAQTLPPELLTQIFSYLPWSYFDSIIPSVCPQWRAVVYESFFQEKYCSHYLASTKTTGLVFEYDAVFKSWRVGKYFVRICLKSDLHGRWPNIRIHKTMADLAAEQRYGLTMRDTTPGSKVPGFRRLWVSDPRQRKLVDTPRKVTIFRTGRPFFIDRPGPDIQRATTDGGSHGTPTNLFQAIMPRYEKKKRIITEPVAFENDESGELSYLPYQDEPAFTCEDGTPATADRLVVHTKFVPSRHFQCYGRSLMNDTTVLGEMRGFSEACKELIHPPLHKSSWQTVTMRDIADFAARCVLPLDGILETGGFC